MHLWQRSSLYRLYVVLGLPAIVLATMAAAVNAEPGDRRPMVLGAALAGLWIVGLLVQGFLDLADSRERHLPTGDAYARLALRPADPRGGDALWSFNTKLFVAYG